jgi:general secretion pathway protein D
LVVALTVWCLSLTMVAHAAIPDAHLVAVDFENVDLRLFIKFVSEVTGRVFLLDERVRGQISVRFANKIPVDQLHDVLDSVLEVKGFTTVATGAITKIVPLGGARQRGIEVSGSGPSEVGGRR